MTALDSSSTWASSSSVAAIAAAPGKGTGAPGGTPAENGKDGFALFGEDGFTFGDLLDIINPLQHIPIIGTLYRALTGDEISAGARVAGGTLFGGPIGAAVATVNAVLDESTGKDVGEHVLALFDGNDGDGVEKTQIAEAETATGVLDLGALAPMPASASSINIAALAPLPSENPACPTSNPAAALAVQTALMEARTADASFGAAATVPASASATQNKTPTDDETTHEPKTTEGWLAETMLTALDKYADSTRLAAAAQAASPATAIR